MTINALPGGLLYAAGLLAGLLVRTAGSARGGLATVAIVITTCCAVGFAVASARRS